MDRSVLSCFDTEKGKKLYQAFHTCIVENAMWENISKGVLLGFSGGADSVFLALSFLRLMQENQRFSLVLCHIHHGIRGVSADRDLSFSEQFANDFGLEMIGLKRDVPSISKQEGIGIEECARNVRYSEFQRIIDGRNDVSCIATAHNATDNLETVLHRLLRGTGTKGLCGILAVRDNIIRPILYIPKKDIVSFLDSNHIPYVTDETNADINYTRNYIRNEILPTLTRITPSPEVSILRFVQNIREDEFCLNALARDFLNSQTPPYIDVASFKKLHKAIAYRVLCILAEQVDSNFMLEQSQVEAILSSISEKKSARISLNKRLDFVFEHGWIYFHRRDSHPPEEFVLPFGESVYSSFFRARFLFCDEKQLKTYKNVYKNSTSVLLSSVIINGEIAVRKKAPQDAYRVRKMTRKLKTLFQSLHLPTPLIDRIPVFYDEKGILFVPPFGLREEENQAQVDSDLYLVITYDDGAFVP